MRSSLMIMALFLFAACGSSPKTHFYTLSVAQTGSRRSISFPVQVAAVHLPPSLDRRQMVRMTGANSVEMSEVNRWSAAFGEMVRNVLSQDLAERLPEGRLVLPDAPSPQGTRAIVVTLAQFAPDAAGEVRLRGSWALLGPASDTPIMRRDFSIDAGSAPDASAMAAGMSRALGELADGIAAAL